MAVKLRAHVEHQGSQPKVKIQRGFWRDERNQSQYFDWLADELQISEIEDWYKIKKNQIKDKLDCSMLQVTHGDSLVNALQHIYPDVTWQPWRFAKTTQGYWSDLSNQHEYFLWLATKLGIRTYEDWYEVKWTDVQSTKGASILVLHYNNSLTKALSYLYPEIPWVKWRFKQAPKNYWSDLANQRRFFDELGQKLNIKTFRDWYKVRKGDLIDRGASGILNMYGSCYAKALCNIYSEYEWQPWQFDMVPHGFHKDEHYASDYLIWLANQLCIRHPEEWYSVALDHLNKWKGRAVFHKGYESLVKMLRHHFPYVQWIPHRFQITTRKSQKLLYRIVRELFTNREVKLDYHHPELRFPESNVQIQLDVFVPDCSVAFEYQGTQHYKFNAMYGSPKAQQERDSIKKKLCKEAGITVVDIPWWWEYDKEGKVYLSSSRSKHFYTGLKPPSTNGGLISIKSRNRGLNRPNKHERALENGIPIFG